MEFLFIVSWLASMYVSYIICEAKGRTSWKGVLLSAFFGWIGTIVCACLSKRK